MHLRHIHVRAYIGRPQGLLPRGVISTPTAPHRARTASSRVQLDRAPVGRGRLQHRAARRDAPVNARARQCGDRSVSGVPHHTARTRRDADRCPSPRRVERAHARLIVERQPRKSRAVHTEPAGVDDSSLHLRTTRTRRTNSEARTHGLPMTERRHRVRVSQRETIAPRGGSCGRAKFGRRESPPAARRVSQPELCAVLGQPLRGGNST